ILQNTQARPEKLLMIGGPPEQYFWRARSIVRSNARTEDAKAFFAQKGLPWEQEPVDTNGYARAQLITAIGELPVYGKGFNGEWGIREIASGLPFEEFLSGPARSSMRADMLQLVAEVAGIPPEKVQKVARKKEKDSTTLQQFADGFTKLQQLLQS
ncbi:MAG: hypothetical protein KC680_04430, partial [Candidatus Peregrinibacteria bacterium]|nr:hypothetical protein [Candidatus Peregrinibacteria bacterium]